VTIKGIPAHLTVSDDFDACLVLQTDTFVDGTVLYSFEFSISQVADRELIASFFQVGRS
jgi:hypothetical protein